jgi:hypothetical protein
MIYVDEVRYYETSNIKGFAKRYGNRWCHMFADTPQQLEELHEFARKIGCRRGWFQDGNEYFPHYDLTSARREMAIRAGAQEVKLKEWLRQNRQRAAL